MRTQEQEKSKASASLSPPVKPKKKAAGQKSQPSQENSKSTQRLAVGKKSATGQFNTVFQKELSNRMQQNDSRKSLSKSSNQRQPVTLGRASNKQSEEQTVTMS